MVTPPVTEPTVVIDEWYPPQPSIPVDSIPNECYLTPYEDGLVLTEGNFVFVEVDPAGTHSISGIGCGPPVTETTAVVVAEPAAPQQLPSTGGAETAAIAIIAGCALVAGVIARKLARS